MGVPTSEVGYTPAMPKREDHEVRKDIGEGGGKKGLGVRNFTAWDVVLGLKLTQLLSLVAVRYQ